eukprot:5801136-Pleurochrysis_carterae.AAC.1
MDLLYVPVRFLTTSTERASTRSHRSSLYLGLYGVCSSAQTGTVRRDMCVGLPYEGMGLP